jgi:hypothetical protein
LSKKRTTGGLQWLRGLDVVAVRIVHIISRIRGVNDFDLWRNWLREIVVRVEATESRPIDHDPTSDLDQQSQRRRTKDTLGPAYIVLRDFIIAFQSGETVVFLVMNTHQIVPLLSPLQDCLPEPCFVGMKLEGVSVQGSDRNGSSEGWQVDDGLNSANSNCVAHDTIHEINTLQNQLIHWLPLDRCLLEVGQPKQAREASDGAADDKQCARDEDTIKELKCDLPMLRQPLDSTQSSAVVGSDCVVEKLDRGEQMSLKLRTLLLFQSSLVVQELLVIGDKNLGIKLMKVTRKQMVLYK